MSFEKNVKIPKVTCRKYPFLDMKVGDSVLIRKVKRKRIDGSLRFAEYKLGGKFTARTVDDGVRVWRTK